MRLFKKKADCCGCAACMSACKHHAIKMKADQKGFLYPQIDPALCVGCGQCRKVCPFHEVRGGENRNPQPFAFAVKHKEDAIRERSSSGGVFYALAEYTLNMGGTVYGAVFGEQNQVLHMRGSDLKDVHKMQGSKYVQSSTEGIFEAVKKDLEEGKRERNPKRTDKNTYSKNIKRYFFNYFREEI